MLWALKLRREVNEVDYRQGLQALNFVGEGLREAYDPRRRRRLAGD